MQLALHVAVGYKLDAVGAIWKLVDMAVEAFRYSPGAVEVLLSHLGRYTSSEEVLLWASARTAKRCKTVATVNHIVT